MEFVYVIELHGLTKIGRTTRNPALRVRNMQLPGKPEGVWYSVHNSHETERRAHEQFSSRRVFGEWFSLSAAQKDDLHCLMAEAALNSFSSALRICTERKPIKCKGKTEDSKSKQCR